MQTVGDGESAAKRRRFGQDGERDAEAQASGVTEDESAGVARDGDDDAEEVRNAAGAGESD